MSIRQSLEAYYGLGSRTKAHMKVRKTEFVTEIILSLFVVIITIQRNGNPSFAVGSIAFIHSFNIARAVEAYRDAKIEE